MITLGALWGQSIQHSSRQHRDMRQALPISLILGSPLPQKALSWKRRLQCRALSAWLVPGTLR